MEIEKKKLVSIIVPVYNSEQYIERCIKSVLKQTYRYFELILLNDGSTDDSADIIESYAKLDTRIRYINKINEGVSITRNLGIEISEGEYIMFIDNDDYIGEDYLEKYVDAIEVNRSDLVIGGYQRVNHNEVLFQDYPRDTNWGKYVILSPWAKIYRAQLIKSNCIKFLDYSIGEDIYFNFQVFKYANKISHIKSLDYYWYYNGNSISNTSQRGFNDKIDIIYFLNKLMSVAPTDEKEYLDYFFKRYYVWYLLFNGRNSNYKKFLNEYGKIQKWIRKHQVDKRINPLSKELNGEGYKNRLIVLIFGFLEQTKLLKIFAFFYCKG